MCPTSDGIEDTEHFLLLCPSFDVQRRDLLAGIVELLRPVIQIADLSNDALTQLLLYDDHDLSNDLNRSTLELTLHLIQETGRFDRDLHSLSIKQPPIPFKVNILFPCKFFFTSDVRHFYLSRQISCACDTIQFIIFLT